MTTSVIYRLGSRPGPSKSVKEWLFELFEKVEGQYSTYFLSCILDFRVEDVLHFMVEDILDFRVEVFLDFMVEAFLDLRVEDVLDFRAEDPASQMKDAAHGS